jgi:hypothetical protein
MARRPGGCGTYGRMFPILWQSRLRHTRRGVEAVVSCGLIDDGEIVFIVAPEELPPLGECVLLCVNRNPPGQYIGREGVPGRGEHAE